MDHPCLVELGNLEMLIWSRILDLSRGTVIDDESQIPNWATLRRIYGDVEIDAKTVGARDGDLTLAPDRVFGGRIPGVERPPAVVSVRPEIMDAHFACWNRRGRAVLWRCF